MAPNPGAGCRTSTPCSTSWARTRRAQLRVDGGQHLGQLLDLGDRQPPRDQGLGHLQADVAGADDHRPRRCGLFEGAHHREGVVHGVQQVHPVWLSERIGAGQPLDRRPHRDRPGAHHECVVADQLLAAAGVADGQPVAGGIDAPSHGVEPELHPRRLEVGDGAVGEVLPAWHLAGDVVGDAADREVGIAVGDHNGHLYARVELARAQGRANAGVTAADGNEMHGASSSRVGCARR